jgi:putative Mg2+ transporter-C (MgtC) family protein
MEIEWALVLQHFLKISAAFVLAMPIGWEREKSTRIMGLRTFPLVAIASCGFILIARQAAGLDGEAQARIIQGLMTGIGFIGGGAILKEGKAVRGTATAASIWITGAMGAAIAHGRYEIAVLMSAATFLTLNFLKPNRRNNEESEGKQANDDMP